MEGLKILPYNFFQEHLLLAVLRYLWRFLWHLLVVQHRIPNIDSWHERKWQLELRELFLSLLLSLKLHKGTLVEVTSIKDKFCQTVILVHFFICFSLVFKEMVMCEKMVLI